MSNNRVNSGKPLPVMVTGEAILTEAVSGPQCADGTSREQGVSWLSDKLPTSARHLSEVMMCSMPRRKSGGAILARAILIPPRQNILCTAKIFALPDGGVSNLFGLVQPPGRNMLSLRDNLNACDGIQKVITFSNKVDVIEQYNQPITGQGCHMQPCSDRRAPSTVCCSAGTCSNNCPRPAEPAVSKPTSYEEPFCCVPRSLRQPRGEPTGNGGKPRETRAAVVRVVPTIEHGVVRMENAGLLNGGQATESASTNALAKAA